MEKGITIIELLLVISIIALLGTMSTPFISSFILRNNFDTTVDRIVGTIRKAQNYALDGKNNDTWGVCISGSAIRLFRGSCTSPTISEDFDIPTSVTVSGLSTTTFSGRGEPSGALTISVTTSIDSGTITLSAAGGITTN